MLVFALFFFVFFYRILETILTQVDLYHQQLFSYKQSLFIWADTFSHVEFSMTVIRPFRNEKGTGAEMHPTIVSGIVTRYRSAIGQFFSLSLVTVPQVFAKVNSTQFPSFFCRGWAVFSHILNGNGYKRLAQRFLTIKAFSIINNRLTLDVISQS